VPPGATHLADRGVGAHRLDDGGHQVHVATLRLVGQPAQGRGVRIGVTGTADV
jgi:hypothetical protein